MRRRPFGCLGLVFGRCLARPLGPALFRSIGSCQVVVVFVFQLRRSLGVVLRHKILHSLALVLGRLLLLSLGLVLGYRFLFSLGTLLGLQMPLLRSPSTLG